MLKIYFNDCSIEDFGFEHRLWIYSGRRGVHCWVCDPTARELQSSIRQAIVEHLTVLAVGIFFDLLLIQLIFIRVEKIQANVSLFIFHCIHHYSNFEEKLHMENFHRMEKCLEKLVKYF